MAACAAILACDAGSNLVTVQPLLPLDISSTTTDLNGFPIDPLLGEQVNNPMGPGKLAQSTASLPCEPHGNGLVVNNDQATATNWYTGPHPCTHFHVTTHSGNALFGHVNFMPVLVHGRIYWEEHGSDDDDYTFDIATINNGLGAVDRTYQNDGKTGLVHSEFDSDEAIDPLLDQVSANDPFWWKLFKQAVDDQNQSAGFITGIDGKEVIAIGLYNLDCAYGNGHNGCGVELHPLYIMAIHLSSVTTADRWLLFAFNYGDQGYTGSDRIALDSNNAANANYNGVDEQYTLILPRPQGTSFVPTITHEDVRILPSGTTVYDAVANKYFAAVYVPGTGERLDFRLRYPDKQNSGDHYVILGDMTLDWGQPFHTVVPGIPTVPSSPTSPAGP
jgi:hypothetical protein